MCFETLFYIICVVCCAILVNQTNVAQFKLSAFGAQCEFRIIRNTFRLPDWDTILTVNNNIYQALRIFIMKLTFGALAGPEQPGHENPPYSSNQERWDDY